MYGNVEFGPVFHRGFVISLLFFVFALSYFVTPYWMINRSPGGMVLLAGLTIAFGLLWSFAASGPFKINIGRKDLPALAFLFGIACIFNARPLFSDIPWCGDEDYHIFVVLKFLNNAAGPAIPSIVIFVLFLYAGWRKSKWALPLGVFALVAAVIGNLFYPIDFHSILRYPFFSRFFQALAPGLASPFVGMYHEVLYRIVPLLSAILIAWVCHRTNPSSDWRIKLAFGVSAALMPVVWYYSSVLYLEMPIVFLMLVAFCGIRELLNDDWKKMRTNPGWYALITTGFVKETALLVLFPFVACRLLIRFVRARKAKTGIGRRFLSDELKIVFCALLPVIVYVAYRAHFNVSRTFSPGVAHLLNPDPYFAVIRAWVEQFGGFSPLFIAGSVLAAYRKKFELLFFSWAMILAVTVFMILDNPEYSGYSRFNLFVVPPILIVSTECFSFFRKKIVLALILVCLIASDIALSPIHPDGAKKPLWGNYLCDTSEHYYPYEKTLKWLEKNHGEKRHFFTGMNYPYSIGLKFYFYKLEWFPDHILRKTDPNKSADIGFADMFEQAVLENCDVIVYHVPKYTAVRLAPADGWAMAKTFENSAHRIVVYLESPTQTG